MLRLTPTFALFVCMLLSCMTRVAALDPDFTQKAFPIIFLVGLAIILVIAVLLSLRTGGTIGHMRNHLVFAVINILLLVLGVFLIFGPDGSVRAEVIGIQLILQAIIGHIIIFSATPLFWQKVYTVLAIFNGLCLIGSLSYLSYGAPIWALDTAQCNFYFGATSALNRCKTDGYLQFLRIVGSIAFLLDVIAAIITLTAWLDPASNDRFGKASLLPTRAPGTGGQAVTHTTHTQHNTTGVHTTQPAYDQVQVQERPTVHTAV